MNWRLAAVFLALAAVGCGPTAKRGPVMTDQEIQSKASEHDALSKQVADQYRKGGGPAGGHGGK